MTNLVGILCGDKKLQWVFLSTLIFLITTTLFLSSFISVFAQGGPAGGPVPGGGVVNAPTGPAGGPVPIVPVTQGNSGNAVDGGGTQPDGGNGTGDLGQTGGDYQTQEVPTVVIGEIDDPILKVLHAIVITGLGWLVGMFGSLFDFSVNYFIIGFGDQFINYNIGTTVNDLWATVRDIFNLTFIFGLVYIGFKMILDSSDSSARKMLVSLVGAALLVNFSLFIIKFIVDFSNIAAFQVYKAFSGSADGTYSITEGFMNLMGIRSLIGVSYVESGAGGYQYIIGLLIVFLVLAYVFLAGAIMIIIRFALLTIYMIFSPIMFLGWVFPSLQNHSSKYWSGFLGQAFFAPAFIFMLYLSYRVADSYAFSQKSFEHLFNTSNQVGTLTPTIGGIDPTVPYFAMVIVFLVASIVVAKNIGATSAKLGISIGGKVVGGATAGLAARAGRTAIGGGASALTQNKTFRKLAANTGFVGRGVMLATANVADRSFDARQVGGIGKKLGAGEGKKGGFTTRLKEAEEREKKYDKLMGKNDPEDDTEVKQQRAKISKLTKSLAGEQDEAIREQIEGKLVQANEELAVALTKASKPENVYANQLTYVRNKENWLKKQKLLLNGVTAVGAGIGLGLLSGGIITGVAAAAGAYGAVKGINGQTKADIKTIRKEYGNDGGKKKENDAAKAAAAAVAKALKEAGEGPKPKTDDH
jgi:hypothetical protein